MAQSIYKVSVLTVIIITLLDLRCDAVADWPFVWLHITLVLKGQIIIH